MIVVYYTMFKRKQKITEAAENYNIIDIDNN